MKKLTILFALLFVGSLGLQAQSQKACCAGKKAACAKEASAKKACCAKNENGKACAKMASNSEAATPVRTVATTDDFVKTASIRVYGNCGMCKRTIEGALNKAEGVRQASWDVSTGMLSVAYVPDQIDQEQIKAKVAAVGYDSDTHRAPDEVYSALHACCQYERPKG